MSEFNKIFGRDFLTAFILPALFFLVASSLCLSSVGVHVTWLEFDPKESLKETTVLALMTFVFGVFLQSINRELFRMTEGYWGSSLRKRLSYFQRRRFRNLRDRVPALRAERDLCHLAGRDFPHQFELNEVVKKAATRFPHREDLVLPTTFGNVVRAYEDYPRVMYGFESINGWSRLQALFSKQVAEVLARSRARVDMWLNLCFMNVVLQVEILIVAWRFDKRLLLWLVPAGLLLALFAYVRARSSAEGYGEQVKAIHDIYLPQLSKKLGFKLSPDNDANRKFWQAYSQAMVYREPDMLKKMSSSGLQRTSAPKSENASGSSDGDEDE